MQMWGGTCLHPHRLMLLSLQVHMWIIVVYALKSCINIAESMEDKRKPHFTVLPKVTGLTKNIERAQTFAYVSLMSFAYVYLCPLHMCHLCPLHMYHLYPILTCLGQRGK